MSDPMLRVFAGVAALTLSSMATAQMDRRAVTGMNPHATPPAVTAVNWTSIPLRDDSGTVRARLIYFKGTAGSRQIRFVDSNGVLINSITEAPAPAPAASDNPLRGEAIPKLGENFGAAKSDNISEINFLKGQIEALRRQVNRLTDRINAAAAK